MSRTLTVTLTFTLTLLAMIAFAGNSLLCRLALKHSSIDAASFTSIRIVSGALTLWLIMRGGRSAKEICHEHCTADAQGDRRMAGR